MDEVLAGTVLFQGLPADAAERLGKVAERRKVTHGDVIFRQGEPGASMYVILRGKVRVTRPADPGRDNLLTLLGPGDLFGELTLFDPAPRRNRRLKTLCRVAAERSERGRRGAGEHFPGGDVGRAVPTRVELVAPPEGARPSAGLASGCVFHG